MARPNLTATPRRPCTVDGDELGRGLLRRLRAVVSGPHRMTVIGLALLAAGIIAAALAALQASPHTPVAAAPTTVSVATPDRVPSSTPTPAAPSSSSPSGASADPTVATPVAALPDTGTTVIGVQTGDTLGALAHRYGTTVPALQALNGLGNSTRIDAGQQLRVPAGHDPLLPTVAALPSAPSPATVTPATAARAAAPGTTAAAAPPTVAAVSARPAHHHNPRDQRGGQHQTTSRTGSTGSIHSHHLSSQGGTTAMTHHRHTHARHTQPTAHRKGHR
ncbi:LysM peptidoglycan-binding domain-containing protein [Kutzneria buriramensis]|uniref:LysM domain-containing protein n=1 Tax=Kutzneria buriramensis TaxID=1045776 RepID=A0A3E0I8S8_9PSEU|nr:LysM peptidoglycan-binding domain-containing protein [Kutzneria buriramensis]REH55178.1 LysM domain-containing protein [Kutzneria buriramensis]